MHTIQSVQEKSDKIHNNEYTILSEPKGSFSKIKILHKKCDNEYFQVVSTHISGCGCPKCNTFSKGEVFIENYLKDNNIEYYTQKTFDMCKYVNKLKFDFYLPEYDTKEQAKAKAEACIEFDGEQHFKPIRYLVVNLLLNYKKSKIISRMNIVLKIIYN